MLMIVCYPTSKPSVSAVLIGFHGINLFKNLVSRELLRILENFHFSISISKHFDFTIHFSKKSESIFFLLCTSRKRVKVFCFHFSLLELQKPTLAGPCIMEIWYKKGCESCEHIKFYLFLLDSLYGGFKKDA